MCKNLNVNNYFITYCGLIVIISLNLAKLHGFPSFIELKIYNKLTAP